MFFIFLGLFLIQSSATMGAKVKVEALGFFSHPPMHETRDTIQKVCKEFGNRVELTMYDEWSPDGQNFMQSKKLSGHLPMVLYVNGAVAHRIGGRVVTFRDFVGYSWTAEDLEQVIKLNLEGKKTAVPGSAS
jgi:hypothetical protein